MKKKKKESYLKIYSRIYLNPSLFLSLHASKTKNEGEEKEEKEEIRTSKTEREKKGGKVTEIAQMSNKYAMEFGKSSEASLDSRNKV